MHRTAAVFVLLMSLGFTVAPDSFWTRLSALWSGVEEGCGMDPNGRCLPAQPDHADEGCTADPNGRCNQLWQKAGGGWDPDGLVLPDPEEGGGWDPNGIRRNPGS